jgi:hypothetical protein
MIAIAKQTMRFWKPLQAAILSLTALFAVAAVAPVIAQSTPLRPPIPAQGTVAAPTSKPIAVTNLRIQNLKINGKLVDLRALPDSQILKAASGKSISVARMKQLETRLNTARPIIVAQKNQSLRSLTATPAGTRIALPNGRMTNSAQLSQIQKIYARLGEKRLTKPLAIPVSQPDVPASGTVGANLTMAQALMRPGSELIQVGKYKFTAEQLRLIDSQLKVSRDPRGLVDRMNAAPAMGARK